MIRSKALSVLLAVGVAGSVATVVNAAQPSDELSDQMMTQESACASILAGEEHNGRNTLHGAGLTNDQVPVGLFRRFEVRGIYCLADELEGRVDSVFVEFWNGNDEVVGSWLVYADDHGTASQWTDYFRSVYQDQFPVDITTRSHAIIAFRRDRADGDEIRSQARDQSRPVTSLWDEVRPVLKESQEGP